MTGTSLAISRCTLVFADAENEGDSSEPKCADDGKKSSPLTAMIEATMNANSSMTVAVQNSPPTSMSGAVIEIIEDDSTTSI